MTTKYVDVSSSTAGDRFQNVLGAIHQLSTGDLVWLAYDPAAADPNKVTIKLATAASNHTVLSTIATLSGSASQNVGNFWYSGRPQALALCPNDSDDLFVIGAASAEGSNAHDDLCAQAFKKGTGLQWTPQTFLRYDNAVASGTDMYQFDAVWCNSGGGTNSRGHLVVACQTNASPGCTSLVACDAGAILNSNSNFRSGVLVNAGTGGMTQPISLSPDGFGATSGVYMYPLQTGAGSLLPLWEVTYAVKGWGVTSAGSLTTGGGLSDTQINIPLPFTGGPQPKLRLYRVKSNLWAAIYPATATSAATVTGKLTCRTYSSSAMLGSADSDSTGNFPLAAMTSEWDAIVDGTGQLFVLAPSTATRTTILRRRVDLSTPATPVWNAPANDDTLVGSNPVMAYNGTNGVVIPATLSVTAMAAGMPTSGLLVVNTSTGLSLVQYTGISANTFTGCTVVAGGSGTVATSALVSPHSSMRSVRNPRNLNFPDYQTYNAVSSFAINGDYASFTPPAPNAPTLLTPPASSVQQFATSPVSFSWADSFPATGDSQTLWYLRRAAAGGTYQYLRASDMTWQSALTPNFGNATSVTFNAGVGGWTQAATFSWTVQIAGSFTTGRQDKTCATTSGSAVVSDAAITAADVGAPVSGTGIPANAYILSVVAGTSFTMSATATATGTITVSVGQLSGWAPEWYVTSANPVPAAPVLTASYSSLSNSATITVQSSDSNARTASVEFSDDGVTWTFMRNATALSDAYANLFTLTDVENAPNIGRQYRARAWTAWPTSFSAYVSQTVGAPILTGHSLKDPLDGTTVTLRIKRGSWQTSFREGLTVHYPLGRSHPLVIADVVGGEDGQFTVLTLSNSEDAALLGLLQRQRVLLLQSPLRQWYIRRVSPVAVDRSLSATTAQYREHQIGYAEVDRPL